MPVQRWSDRIWVAQLARDPAFSEDVDSLMHRALQPAEPHASAAPVPHVVVDLSGVDYVNSANLSKLLQLRRMMVEGDARLRLAGPTDQVWAVFLASGLDKVFEFAPDTGTALAELQLLR